MKNILLALVLISFCTCQNAYKAKEETAPDESDFEEEVYESEGDGIIDSEDALPDEVFTSKAEQWAASNFDFAGYSPDLINIIKERIDPECYKDRPKTIEELTDGVLIEAYTIDKNRERNLNILGFFNVNLKKNQKIVVVEFSQEGTQYCSGVQYKYGVGARMLMHILSSKRGAKLNTPQQITASVIFGMAEVTYSLRTFGITGPSVAKLNKAGALSEDTYQSFLQEISNLIVEMYKKDGSYIITPQPLFSTVGSKS